MKKILTAMAIAALAGGTSFAAVILNNNFNSMTVGSTYNGITGQSLGTDTLLGNATGQRNAQAVTSNGTGGSNAFYHNQDLAIRTRNPADATLTTTFSMMFRFEPDTTSLNGMAFAGWALANATDNTNVYNYDSGRSRIGLLVYRSNATTNEVRIRQGADMANSNSTNQTGTANLTVGNWYRFGFDMTYNYTGTRSTSNITYTDIRLEDWGTAGTSLVSTLITASMTMPVPTTPTSGHGTFVFDSVNSVYGIIVGNDDRGVDTVDNVYISQIPEPASFGMLVGAGALMILRRRLRRG